MLRLGAATETQIMREYKNGLHWTSTAPHCTVLSSVSHHPLRTHGRQCAHARQWLSVSLRIKQPAHRTARPIDPANLSPVILTHHDFLHKLLLLDAIGRVDTRLSQQRCAQTGTMPHQNRTEQNRTDQIRTRQHGTQLRVMHRLFGTRGEPNAVAQRGAKLSAHRSWPTDIPRSLPSTSATEGIGTAPPPPPPPIDCACAADAG